MRRTTQVLEGTSRHTTNETCERPSASWPNDRNPDAVSGKEKTPQFCGSVVPSFHKLTSDEQVRHIVGAHGEHLDRAYNLAGVHHDLHRGRSVDHVHFSGF